MTEIVELPISKLVPDEKNPRKIDKEQFDKLIKSINEDPNFLKARPVLINEIDGVYYIYGGHQRVQAAKKLKLKNIHCHVEKDLSAYTMRLRQTKDNKTYGEFDFDILANNYEIDELLLSGFKEHELGISAIEIESLDDEKEDKPKQQKECPNCGCVL